MALPLLFSFLGSGLAKAGVLGAAGSFLANPMVAGAIGSGLGTLAETGDPKKALLGGIGSFAGGSIMNNLMGGVAPGATSTNAVSGPMTESLRPMPRPGGLGQAAASGGEGVLGGLFGGKAGDVVSAGMDFASSGAGLGSMIGGSLPALMDRPEAAPRQAPMDISNQRGMEREVRTPGPDFQPGVSGEFDYGVSVPYTTDYMNRYSPQGMAMGGFVDNPYAENYAQERAQMLGGMGLGQPPVGLGQPPMQMADGGEVVTPTPYALTSNSVREALGEPVAMMPAVPAVRQMAPMAPVQRSTPQSMGVEQDYGFAMPEPTPIIVEPVSEPSSSDDRSSGSNGGNSRDDAMWSDGMTATQINAERNAGTYGRHMPDSARGRSYGDNFGGSSPSQGGFSGSESNHIGAGGLYADGGLIRQMAMGGTVQRMVPGYGAVPMQAGGIAEIGAEAPSMPQPNEREVISAAVAAVQGQHPQPEVALGMFLQQYGEEALRELVDRVQSGEFQDTQERFADGENGEVRGPGDGSGTDDMVPAVVDGQADVLLSDGEFVIRKDSTDALNDEFGDEFMDKMNSAGKRAPEVVKQMVPS